MRHMINAAEPVDLVAVQGFYRCFSPKGLPRGVVVPTYGLAEHTVFVCSGGRHVLHLRKTALEIGKVDIAGEHDLGDIDDVPVNAVVHKDGSGGSGSDVEGDFLSVLLIAFFVSLVIVFVQISRWRKKQQQQQSIRFSGS